MESNEFLHDGLKYLQTNKGFLGREFLTWIWYTTETQNHRVKIPSLGEYKLYLDDKLILSSTSGSVHESSLKGGTPAYAHEAHIALMAGKLLKEAKFILQDGERQWSWSMKAEDLAFRGVKLPPVQEIDSGSHMAARIRHTQLLVEIVNELFKEFLATRISDRFEDEMKSMHTWARDKELH